MSISGYAELMMNGMVPADHVQEFSGRIYHEAVRLSNLVADIIQLSRLDESNSEVPFEEVDLYELAEDVQNNLRHPAEKKNISLELTGSSEKIQGVRHVLYEMFLTLRIMRCAIQNRMVMCVSWSETVREIRFTVW